MYIPSTQLSQLIDSEQYGTWAETYSSGERVALIAKATTTAIKAVAQGCKVQLYVGINKDSKNHYAIALKIYDSAEAPLLLPMTPRTQKEASGILGLIEKLKFSFLMYNEVNFPVVCGEGMLNISAGTIPETFFSKNNAIAETLEDANQLVDSFCFKVDPGYRTQNSHDFSIHCFDLELATTLQSMTVISANEFGAIHNEIDKSDEGLSQEEQLAQFLENIHGNNVYHSPNVKKGEIERELIDVFSFDKRCNYLIESKALCLNKSGYSIADNRKSSTLLKGAKKALEQLHGAAKAIRRGDKISNNDGISLNINREKDIHCIAIVSDLLAMDVWGDVINIIKRKSEEGLYFHVIEFPEFINTIKLSSGPTVSFEQCLLERYGAVVEHKILNIKGIDSSLPMKYEE